MQGPNYSTYVLAVVAGCLVISAGAFAVDTGGGERPAPAEFDRTAELGVRTELTVRARSAGYEIPRAQVFYSEYRYAVGYSGIASLVDDLHAERTRRQFGVPMTVYVTDFAGQGVEVTDEGYLVVPDRDEAVDSWVLATEAYFVVESEARIPGGYPAVVPFGERSAARAFADGHGGVVERWPALRQRRFGVAGTTAASLREARADRRAWANRTVAGVAALDDRPVSVVVGEDSPTLRAAIAAAPPNTTVLVPPGTYRTNITVRKPVTIRGAGNDTHLRGPGNGSVIRVRSPRVMVADLAITGIGPTGSPEDPPVNESDWDYQVQLGYGYGDAGVAFDGANGSLVRNVTIHTPANGVLFRSTDRAVVETLTVEGTEQWVDGFMGVMTMRSRIVVQDSTFRGGRDGVYTHLAHGTVVRDNRMTDMRFGVHEMYTSDLLVANNTARRTNVGVVLMTRPTGNVVVDNDVRESRAGVSVAGDGSYVAGNVVVDNDQGLNVLTSRSIYEHNVVVGNDVGIHGGTLLPTNRVTDNDVVGNDRPVSASLGPLRDWSGNYWAGAPGIDRDGDGRLDRAFRPSSPVDRAAGRVAGGETLARSPAVLGLRSVSGSVPGLRSTGVVDRRPHARPVHPATLADLNTTDRGRTGVRP